MNERDDIDSLCDHRTVQQERHFFYLLMIPLRSMRSMRSITYKINHKCEIIFLLSKRFILIE